MKNKMYSKLFRYGILIISVISFLILANITLANPKVHWAYIGEENPTIWGKLSPDLSPVRPVKISHLSILKQPSQQKLLL